MEKKYVIGIDYGTDSVRSVVVDTNSGKIAGSSVISANLISAGGSENIEKAVVISMDSGISATKRSF